MPDRARQVTLSLPEIRSLATRAGRGAGFTWGMAEECGWAAAWLARRDARWSQTLLNRLIGEPGAEIVPNPVAWRSAGPICALHAGATLADFAALPEGLEGHALDLGHIHHPALLIPFVAKTAGSIGASIDIDLNGKCWARCSGDMLAVDDVMSPDDFAHVQLKRSASSLPLGTEIEPRSTPAPLSQTTYDQLTDLALRTTVPATEISHARAGSDSGDND